MYLCRPLCSTSSWFWSPEGDKHLLKILPQTSFWSSVSPYGLSWSTETPKAWVCFQQSSRTSHSTGLPRSCKNKSSCWRSWGAPGPQWDGGLFQMFPAAGKSAARVGKWLQRLGPLTWFLSERDLVNLWQKGICYEDKLAFALESVGNLGCELGAEHSNVKPLCGAVQAPAGSKLHLRHRAWGVSTCCWDRRS